MKAYAVINHALHHDSSYWRIIGIFDNEKDARTCIGTDYMDVMRAIDHGDFSEFGSLAECPEIFINPDLWDQYIVSDQGFYECWRVEEYDIVLHSQKELE